MAETQSMPITILWILRKEELNCSFESLFLPMSNCRVKNVKDNLFWRTFIWTALHKKIFIKGFKLSFITDKYIRDNFETGYFDIKPDIGNLLAKFKQNTIVCCGKFYPYTVRHIQQLHAVPAIIERVDKFLDEHRIDNYIGIHIRQTDNIPAIELSPIQLFKKKVVATINAGNKIVLCTDSYLVQEELVSQYPQHVFTSEGIKDRTSPEGIQNAFVEMIVLSKAKKIYASYGSTFSLTAAEIGQIPIEILKK